jgi:hypothetical protein
MQSVVCEGEPGFDVLAHYGSLIEQLLLGGCIRILTRQKVRNNKERREKGKLRCKYPEHINSTECPFTRKGFCLLVHAVAHPLHCVTRGIISNSYY